MNDFSDISSFSDAALLKEIGAFIKAKRVEKNMTQHELATRAAISRSTLSLMERGENIALSNLLKILRILDLLYLFNAFRAETQISPLRLAKEEEKKRQRASKKRKENPLKEWG